MALNNLGLGFVFTARDLASGAIQNLERNFMSLDQRVGLGAERIQGAFQQLGVGLSVFTAGAATVGAAFSLANAAFGLAGRYFASLPRACRLWWAIADCQPDSIIDSTLELEPERWLLIPSLRVLTDVILGEQRRTRRCSPRASPSWPRR